MLKILQVIDKLDLGGAERVFIDMSNLLFEHQYHVDCLFLIEKGYLGKQLNPGIHCFQLNRKNKFSLQKMMACAKIIRSYDIVHCHMRHVYRYIKLVSLIFTLDNKIILHEHSGLIHSKSKSPFLFTSFFKPDYFIGVSRNQTDWAVNILKVIKKSVYYLPNTIFWDSQIAKEIKVRSSDLLLIGNIKENKNQIFAVEIIKKLKKSLNIIGSNQYDPYYLRLTNMINKLKADVIIYEDLDTVKDQICSSKMGISTSIHESGPLVLIEYLYAGIPFLAYKTGEVSAIVAEHFPEFFIDNFNIDEWCSRIMLILEKKYSPDDLKEIYHIHFSPKIYFERLTTIYSQICGS
jgi:glycosyltransferase involved in cell wall biosynthesis